MSSCMIDSDELPDTSNRKTQADFTVAFKVQPKAPVENKMFDMIRQKLPVGWWVIYY